MEELKYPIGQYKKPDFYNEEQLQAYIGVIAQFPKKLKYESEQLTETQLDTPYRPGGWTIRQLINHCADSHMNALIRVKLALTEDRPVIKPYAEALWAGLADGNMETGPAFLILEGLHQRWVHVLNSLKGDDWKRSFFHPEKSRALTLEESTGLYAWHCEHHLAHLTELKKRMGWE